MAATPEPRVEVFTATELGNTTYLVADPDSGQAVCVDPLRDVDQYLDRADSLGVKVVGALETHVHNDFISGSRELQAEAGAQIFAAHDSELEFPFEAVREGSEVAFGRFRLRVRHTPGHTPQHLSYVLLDERGRSRALFSGGALMVGAIARTDLFGPHLSTQLALQAFRTVHVRLRDLPDDAALYPTHGGGSFCGAATSDQRTSTLGAERRTNPFLLTTELMPFIARALHQAAYPAYYRLMTPANRRGMPLIGRHFDPPPALGADRVAELMEKGAAVIDMRRPNHYDRGHVPGSYCIGFDGPFSAWVGWVIGPDRPLVLLGRDREIAAAHRQLLRIGYDRVAGYLDGGVDAWAASGRHLGTFETAEVEDLATWVLSAEPMTVLDVRDEDEWVHGHVPGAVHLTVPSVEHHAHELPGEAPVAVHCGVGYRAGIAASILERAGFRRIVHVTGPYSDWDRLHLAETIPG
jgi:hydroxyacylglutathione hydrolase